MKTFHPYEFCKLDSIDLKVTSWLHRKCPHILHSYLEFLASNDYRRKGIKLNAKKIYHELIEANKVYVD